MRELRRALKDAGFKPAPEGEPLQDNQFPISGSFTVTRDGKQINAKDVALGDKIVLPPLIKHG